MAYGKFKDLLSERKLYVGKSVFLKEDTSIVEYRIVNVGYGDNDNVVVLMRMYANLKEKYAFNDDASSNNGENRIYEGNTLDNYLKNTLYNKYPSTIRNAIVSVPIQVADKNGKIYTINRKVFAPSATEVGFGPMDGYNPQEGTTLEYFSAAAESRRKYKEQFTDENGVEWNTRTRNCGTGISDKFYCIGVQQNGEYEKIRWQINPKYVRPCFCINADVTVDYIDSTGYIIGNLPPEVPAVKSAPSEVMCETPFTIEWTESKNGSADIDSNIAPKYQVQYRADDGEWIDASTSTGLTIYSTALGYKEADKVIFRVRAFDGYSNYSAWVLFPEINVINNVAPEAPAFLNITGQFTDAPIAVTWGTSTDSDYNLSGYRLYRSIDGGDFELAYEGPNTSFKEISGSWNTVAYKVNAYDDYGYESKFTESEKNLEVKCTMTLTVSDDSYFTEDGVTLDDTAFVSGFITSEYDLADTKEGLTYSIALAIDGMIFTSVVNQTVGKISIPIQFDVWQKWLNGEHKLTAIVTDSNEDTTSLDTPFTKASFALSLTLAEPIVLSEEAKRFMFAVTGEFPEGVSVSVTNNANDDDVYWQELSEEQYSGSDYIEFENEAIENGFAFNFSIEASTTEGGGVLSSVSGIVGENRFELLLSKIEELDNRVSNLE